MSNKTRDTGLAWKKSMQMIGRIRGLRQVWARAQGYARRYEFAVPVVVFCGLLVTMWVAFSIKNNIDDLDEQQFEAEASEIQHIVEKRLNDYAQLLLCGAAFFNASDKVSRKDWRAFAERVRLERQLPGTLGFGYAVRIPRSELSQHQQTIQDEGFSDYKVWPEGDRDVYSSIIFLEPFTGRNLRAFGYDMFAEPVRREAMERACDSDAASLSGKVRLVQETEQDVQPGILIYVPVYRKGALVATVEQRRAALIGWVYMPCRMRDVLKGALRPKFRTGGPFLDLRIYDGTSLKQDDLLYESLSKEALAGASRIRFRRDLLIDLNGCRWTLSLCRRGVFFSPSYRQLWFALACCMTIVTLITALIGVLLQTGAKARKLADKLTLDLQVSKNKYQFLVENSHAIIFTLDGSGVLTFVSSAWTTLLGHDLKELLGLPLRNFIHPEDWCRFSGFQRLVMDSGLHQERVEYRIRNRGGIWRWHTSSAMPIKAGHGDVEGIECTAYDISERKEMEASLLNATERLALAIKTGGVGIWEYDVVGGRLAWDEQMFRLYGVKAEDFCGNYEDWKKRLHPDDRQKGNDEIELALKGAEEFNSEFRVLWPDGSTHYIRGMGVVQRGPDGSPVRMLGTNWDISAQKAIEEKLRQSERNFRIFFATMTDMIIVASPDGKMIYMNRAVPFTLGYTNKELHGMHLLDLHPADVRAEAEGVFARMLRKEVDCCPLPLISKQGALVPVETRVWFGRWNGSPCIFGICKNLSREQEARQLFERLFQNNPCLIALSSFPDKIFVDINETFVRCLGYSRQDVIGKTAVELNIFVDLQQGEMITKAARDDGRVAELEVQVRCKDGNILDGLFSAETIVTQGQRFLMTVMVDITARKRSEAELARLSRIQHTLMLLATGFVNVPLDRQNEAVNQSLETMGNLIHADRAYLFDYDFKNGVTSNTHEWCAPGIVPEINNLQSVPLKLISDWVSAHVRGERTYIPDVLALGVDSGLRKVLEPQGIRSLITLPLMQGGSCVGFVGFDAVREQRIWREEEVSLLQVLAELYSNFEARRASDRAMRELQERLMTARDAAQDAARAKSLFLANMSHEIRTPLNAILGYAQIMGRECSACPTSQKLVAITRSGEHLLELLTDLLELVRADSSEVKLDRQSFDFSRLLEDVRLMFVHTLAVKSLSLRAEIAKDVPHFICAAPGKIRQILVNLVGNAVKCTDAGGVVMRAFVQKRMSAKECVLGVDVEDSGVGLNSSEWDRIFELFVQTESSRRVGKGTGLGLPLSRRFARALGGDVQIVHSSPGQGSCFRFTFSAEVSSSVSNEVIRRGTVLRLAPDQNCRVLVVDDDQACRDMLCDMLVLTGFQVETACGAGAALECLASGAVFDVVLMDKRMPDMDGYDAICKARRLSAGPDLRFLVVSATEDAAESGAAIASGADGVVAKPIRREQLLEDIRRLTKVRYEYEADTADASLLPAKGLNNQAVKNLSITFRVSLKSALQRGDIVKMRALVEQVSCVEPEAAQVIRELLGEYDYARLRQLIDACESGETA